MKKLLKLIAISLILVGCKQWNCSELVLQRYRAIQNNNIGVIVQTDSLIINYCK